MTRRETFEALKAIPENADYVEFLDAEIASIDRKAAKAKEDKAKKDVASAENKEIIFAAITDTPQTVNEITEAVADKIEDVTRNKVIPKLTSLVKEGRIEKSEKRIDGKSVKVYALPGTFDEDNADAE